MPKKQEPTLDQLIAEAIKNAPKIKGYTIKEIADYQETPWPTTRWKIETMEQRPRDIALFEIGRNKIHVLPEKKKKGKK